MKPVKFLLPAMVTLSSLLSTTFVACSEESDGIRAVEEAKNGKTSSDTDLPKGVKSYETEDDMPNCTSKNNSTLAFIEADSTAQICQDGKWQSLGKPFDTEDDLPNCTDKRDGQTAYLWEEGSTLVCTDGEWEEEFTDDEDTQSSADAEPEGESKSSSSTKSGESESSSRSSSSAKSTVPPAPDLFLSALIYDSDQTLNPLFSSDGDKSGYGSCTGVRPEIVKTNLGSDGKPQFNTSSNATLCAGTADNFSTLFNYTENVNEISLYNLPITQDETSGMYVFDSDVISYNGYTGGFFPIDSKTDDDILKDLSPTTCAACRTMRLSGQTSKWGRDEVTVLLDDRGNYVIDEDGDVVTTVVAAAGVDYKYCNGPGWDGGNDCGNCVDPYYGTSGACFANGDMPAVWDWTIDRWSKLRNHQFCMELKGSFTYKAGQEAMFYSGGDLWVFINGKLAVDLGGNHLPAPGYIDMETLNSNYSDYMTAGKTYPIDIFFCARRTAISTFAMKTSFKITQK